MANKDNKGARQSLRKALEIQPDYLEAQSALMLLDVGAKAFPDAIKTARTVQQQRPNAPHGYVFEGDIANEQRNWVASAAAYRAALARGAPLNTAIKLHAVLVAAGKGAEADGFALKWLKERPNDVAFLAYQGQLAVGKKDYAAADRQYLAALNIQPDNPVVLNNLAWVRWKLRKDGGLEYAEKSNKLLPNQPAIMETLALLLADNNDFSRAIELQTRAVGLQPSNSALRLALASIYIKAGDKTRARTELEALAKLGDSFRSQPEVKALLQSL